MLTDEQLIECKTLRAERDWLRRLLQQAVDWHMLPVDPYEERYGEVDWGSEQPHWIALARKALGGDHADQ